MTNPLTNLIETFRTQIKENDDLLRKIGKHDKESLDKENPLQGTQQESVGDSADLPRTGLDG
jgi:hypothetical protein